MTAALVALVLPACDRHGPDSTAAGPEQPRPVKTTILEDPDQLAERSFTGRTQARHRAWISFRVGGAIEAMSGQVGDEVEQGEVLARLDDSDYANEVEELEASLEAAQARQAYALTEYLRAEKLLEDDVITQAEHDQAARQRDEANAEVRSLKASLSLARDRLAYTRLRAPFHGTIAERRYEPHESVQPHEPVFMLEDLEHIEVEVGVPEELMVYRDRLREVEVHVPALDRTYTGTVRTVGVDVLPERQTYPVKVLVDDRDDELLPGMTAEVTFRADLAADGKLRLPLTAIHDHEGEPQVWIRGEDGRVTRRPVEIAGLDRSSALIESGVNAGDEIVTAGAQRLHEGQETRRMEAEAP